MIIGGKIIWDEDQDGDIAIDEQGKRWRLVSDFEHHGKSVQFVRSDEGMMIIVNCKIIFTASRAYQGIAPSLLLSEPTDLDPADLDALNDLDGLADIEALDQ